MSLENVLSTARSAALSLGASKISCMCWMDQEVSDANGMGNSVACIAKGVCCKEEDR